MRKTSQGGSGDNSTGTILEDQATGTIASGSAPFIGMFRPREPLAQLIDEIVAGNRWESSTSNFTIRRYPRQQGCNERSSSCWTILCADIRPIGPRSFFSTIGSSMMR